jgi:E3 ubiquitin-protein ligase RFWD2
VSFTVVDGLMALLAEKTRKMEQEEADTNMRILLDFLYCLSKQKLDDLNEVLEFFFCLCLRHTGF